MWKVSCWRQKAASSWRFPQSWRLQQQAQAAATGLLACLDKAWLQSWKAATCWITKHPWASLGALTRQGPIPPLASPVDILHLHQWSTLQHRPKQPPTPLSLGGPRQLPSRCYVTSPLLSFCPLSPPWTFNPRSQEAWGAHSTPWQALNTSISRQPTRNTLKFESKITCPNSFKGPGR